MEEEQNRNWFVIILIIALIWALFFHKQKYEGQTAEEWFYEYDYCESRLSEYQDALDEANANIEEAKSWTWESYEDMGFALDDLETVSEP